MIQECPSSLKENIMQALYGKHLSNHFLFSSTHMDFLRQLVVQLQRFVFFPGDSIVEKGDFDCCMYFVNSGEVSVYEIKEKTEVKIMVLTSGMSFGEAQGLFCISHQYSYKANTVCDILILNRNRWEYLLKWFPASNENIIQRAHEYRLDNFEAATARRTNNLWGYVYRSMCGFYVIYLMLLLISWKDILKTLNLFQLILLLIYITQ